MRCVRREKRVEQYDVGTVLPARRSRIPGKPSIRPGGAEMYELGMHGPGRYFPQVKAYGLPFPARTPGVSSTTCRTRRRRAPWDARPSERLDARSGEGGAKVVLFVPRAGRYDSAASVPLYPSPRRVWHYPRCFPHVRAIFSLLSLVCTVRSPQLLERCVGFPRYREQRMRSRPRPAPGAGGPALRRTWRKMCYGPRTTTTGMICRRGS
jgi:hypothetical protein